MKTLLGTLLGFVLGLVGGAAITSVECVNSDKFIELCKYLFEE